MSLVTWSFPTTIVFGAGAVRTVAGPRQAHRRQRARSSCATPAS